MGVDSKKKTVPPLPAPTETDSTTTTPTELATELATDVSRPNETKSSYSLPDDGTPVTIKTRHKHNRSQTSLLIEYFEGGKGTGSSGEGSERKPSVRVRLTPSKNRKNDHIQITETKSGRKASLTRKVLASTTPAGPNVEGEGFSLLEADDAHSMNSYVSATEESNVSHQPIDIEIDRRRRRPASPLIPTTADSSKVSYQPGNMSEISAIPTDSFLDGSGPSSKSPERRRDKSPSRAGHVLAGAAAGLAAAAVADKVRSGRQDKERVVLPKTRDKDRERSERKHKSKSRTSSTSEKHREEDKSSRRKSSRSHQESAVSAADSSVVSSALSPSHRSDQYSVRSGTSKASSINNPKLLETVEDAIRRLILPELNALKREQSRNHGRRSSITSTSGTSISREDLESDRRRSGASERQGKVREPRDREARNVLLESPAPSVSQESIQETSRDVDSPSHGNLKAAAAGAIIGGLGAAAMGQNEAREQRKRRRAEVKNRSVDTYAEEYDDESEFQPRPPMPLMSEINPSEITRASILSASTEYSQDGAQSEYGATSARNAGTSTDDNLIPAGAPATLAGLGARHFNVSHGDLKALPRTGTGASADDFEAGQIAGGNGGRFQEEYDDYDEVEEEEAYPYDGPAGFYYNQQDVPAPLRYEPYGLERRGLSPIPSVSGYTEGGSEVQQNRDSRITQRTSGAFSPTKSAYRDSYPGTPGSVPSNVMSREFDHDSHSLRSSGYDYRNTAESEIEGASPGQAVLGIGANPNYVHIPMGVESAVASLIDGSMLDGSVLTDSGRGSHGYGAQNSTRNLHEHGFHGTPRQYSGDPILEKGLHMASPPSPDASNSHASDLSRDRSQPQSATFAGEYELDQYGRKVLASQASDRHSPTASEAAITGAAVAAASKALRATRERDMHTVNEDVERDYAASLGDIPQRNRSFKERTLDGHQLANTPKRSVDRLDEYDRPKMSASGVPDAQDPLPEIGFYEQSNPSVVDGRLDGSRRSSQDWSGQRTPTQLCSERHEDDNLSLQQTPTRDGNGLGTAVGLAAGAAAIATAAALASSHNRQASQEHEDWQRTSDDRKRDTLVTNPFEGNSPHVNIPGLGDNVMSGNAPVYQNPGFGGDFGTRSPLHNKVDEGYISQGANKTPDYVRSKGKGVEFSESVNMNNINNMDDPFYTPKGERHLSGMSQGMGSPLYDPSTGVGIDRIESQDIVALMQHLMVRDAQRSARDTEILMTLVRSAAEMRESFEKIKHMIADTEDVIIREVEENTEKTVQRHLGGPRPFPGSVGGARSPLQTIGGSQAGTEDLPTKKQNLFRRALKGLSAKGNNDLGRIEDMLMQLLTEVDTLKTQTAVRSGSAGPGFTPTAPGVESFDNLQPAVQYEHDRGYEPEGHAGTSTTSHASQSGHLSIPQQRVGSTKLGYERKFSDHRISTVPEANEEDFEHRTPERGYRLQEQYAHPDNVTQGQDIRRGGSVPVSTPPHPGPAQGSMSNENTPADKSKKHKSSGSSTWFPKISRWSETTTSSVGKVFRSSKDSKKDADWGYDGDANVDPYGDDKLHTGFSEEVLPQPEDPKYKAHRDSLNLQHPRPRQQACKVAIETGAEDYGVPGSPNSANWAESAISLNRLQGQATNMRPHRYSDMSTPAQPEQQPQFWGSSPIPASLSPSGPPRPPKEPLDSRLTTPKSSRVSKLQKSSPLPYHSVESGYGTATHASYNDSPRFENRNLSGALSGMPTRRPSGPRAMTPKSEDERRRKRDTFGSMASQESETF